MNPEDLARFLRESLEDRKLSRSEKSALADWVEKNVTTDQHRGLARHTAFAFANAEVARTGTPAANEDLIGWLEDVMKVLAPLGPQSTSATAGDSPDAAGTEAFFAPGEQCLQQIIHRFSWCRHTADICVFTITDDRISRAILASHARGVKVRIITDNEKRHDAGSDIHRLQDAGIPVKLDDATTPAEAGMNGHMHHKFAIFDGTRLLNGSYNWTRGAADMNYENITDTGDTKLVAIFSREFERLWNRF